MDDRESSNNSRRGRRRWRWLTRDRGGSRWRADMASPPPGFLRLALPVDSTVELSSPLLAADMMVASFQSGQCHRRCHDSGRMIRPAGRSGCAGLASRPALSRPRSGERRDGQKRNFGRAASEIDARWSAMVAGCRSSNLPAVVPGISPSADALRLVGTAYCCHSCVDFCGAAGLLGSGQPCHPPTRHSTLAAQAEQLLQEGQGLYAAGDRVGALRYFEQVGWGSAGRRGWAGALSLASRPLAASPPLCRCSVVVGMLGPLGFAPAPQASMLLRASSLPALPSPCQHACSAPQALEESPTTEQRVAAQYSAACVHAFYGDLELAQVGGGGGGQYFPWSPGASGRDRKSVV